MASIESDKTQVLSSFQNTEDTAVISLARPPRMTPSQFSADTAIIPVENGHRHERAGRHRRPETPGQLAVRRFLQSPRGTTLFDVMNSLVQAYRLPQQSGGRK